MAMANPEKFDDLQPGVVYKEAFNVRDEGIESLTPEAVRRMGDLLTDPSAPSKPLIDSYSTKYMFGRIDPDGWFVFEFSRWTRVKQFVRRTLRKLGGKEALRKRSR
jgi:hypothetical protein